jgi:hypothetical protein
MRKEIMILKQISIVTLLQTRLLEELDSDQLDRSVVSFLSNQIKSAVDTLDILSCLPDEEPESISGD